MRVGLVQLWCGPDVVENRRRAATMVRQAADHGAELVVLPELFAHLAPGVTMRERAETLEGPTVAWAASLAAELGLHLLGYVVETDSGSIYNTAFVVAPDSRMVARYRKVHLFDIEVPGAGAHESTLFSAGDELVVVPIAGHVVGLTTCYDLRFPELHRILTLLGATVLVVPSAFTAATGPHHWEPLLRARAIENQVFVVAPDQCGTSPDGVARHGHSLVVDPWGRVVTEAGTDETVLVVDLDPAEVVEVRRLVPSLANRAPASYRWPDQAADPGGGGASDSGADPPG